MKTSEYLKKKPSVINDKNVSRFTAKKKDDKKDMFNKENRIIMKRAI
jgi:hypothetical protein